MQVLTKEKVVFGFFFLSIEVSAKKSILQLDIINQDKESPKAAKEIRRPRDRPKNSYKTRLAITNYNTNPLP